MFHVVMCRFYLFEVVCFAVCQLFSRYFMFRIICRHMSLCVVFAVCFICRCVVVGGCLWGICCRLIVSFILFGVNGGVGYYLRHMVFT